MEQKGTSDDSATLDIPPAKAQKLKYLFSMRSIQLFSVQLFSVRLLLVLFTAAMPQAAIAQSFGSFGYQAGFDASSLSTSSGVGMQMQTGQVAGTQLDPVAIATAEYLNFNGGSFNGGVDGRVQTPPIGWASMDNHRAWEQLYDSVRDQNDRARESALAY